MEQGQILILVQKAQKGDQEAFSALYMEFSGKLYRFISIKIPDSATAEDVLQEVFVKAWHGLPRLKLENLNFSAWLYKIAYNTVNDYYRKFYRGPQTVSLTGTFDVAGTASSSRDLESGMASEEVRKALDQLPENYRHVLELRFIQELSVTETARIMGKTGVTIRVLQHRAMQKLKVIYKLHDNEG